jgi:integrase
VLTKLTVALVRRVTRDEPPVRDTSYFDVEVPRLALRVKPPRRPRQRNWAALYFIRYVVDGRERRMKVADPRTVSLDDARKAAREKLAIADRGGDPAAEKAALRDQWTVKKAVEAFIASPGFSHKTPKVQTGHAATLRLHVAYRLGAKLVGEIDLSIVKWLLHQVESDTRRNARQQRLGGLGAARKTARVLSALLTYCADEGQIPTNPLIGRLRLDGDGERTEVIVHVAEYEKLFTTLDDMVGEGVLRPAVRAFFIVAALTGMRRGELQGLRWGQVDLDERRVTLTSTKGMKLAKRGVKTEKVSLPPFAAEVLAELKPGDAGDDAQVFAPQHGAQIEVNRDWIRVQERAGLSADLKLHSLRHSAGTVAVMSGLSGPEVQKLLRHRNISTTARYIHLADQLRLQDRALGHLSPGGIARES